MSLSCCPKNWKLNPESDTGLAVVSISENLQQLKAKNGSTKSYINLMLKPLQQLHPNFVPLQALHLLLRVWRSGRQGRADGRREEERRREKIGEGEGYTALPMQRDSYFLPSPNMVLNI